MTIAVDLGRKATKPTNQLIMLSCIAHFSMIKRSHCGVVDKPLALSPGVVGLIPNFSSLLYETLSKVLVSI